MERQEAARLDDEAMREADELDSDVTTGRDRLTARDDVPDGRSRADGEPPRP